MRFVFNRVGCMLNEYWLSGWEIRASDLLKKEASQYGQMTAHIAFNSRQISVCGNGCVQ